MAPRASPIAPGASLAELTGLSRHFWAPRAILSVPRRKTLQFLLFLSSNPCVRRTFVMILFLFISCRKTY
jgi:hypothetical protein